MLRKCSSSVEKDEEPFDLPLVFGAGVRVTRILGHARSKFKLMVLEAHAAGDAGTGVSASVLPTHGDELICTVTGQT